MENRINDLEKKIDILMSHLGILEAQNEKRQEGTSTEPNYGVTVKDDRISIPLDMRPGVYCLAQHAKAFFSQSRRHERACFLKACESCKLVLGCGLSWEGRIFPLLEAVDMDLSFSLNMNAD